MDTSTKVKTFHIHSGLDLIGSKTSMHTSANTDLELTAIGIKMHSKKTNRTIIIPFANIKGIEMLPQSPKTEEPPAPAKRGPGRPPVNPQAN